MDLYRHSKKIAFILHSWGMPFGLKKLEAINLTDTAVDDSGVAKLKALPALKRMWLFGTKAAAADAAAKVVAK